MTKEYRKIKIEHRDEGRLVYGYAAVFNSRSNDIGFYETINPSAITEETIKRSTVYATLNHDRDKVLARSKNGEGTLKLKVDERGLYYEYEAPHSTLGDDVLEMIKRGDLADASFAFTVSQDEDAQKWEKIDGQYYRTIYKIDKLFDISNVYDGAYSEANTNLRAQEDYYQQEMRKLDQEEEKEEEEKEENDKRNDNNTNDNDGDNANVDNDNTDSSNIEEKDEDLKDNELDDVSNSNDGVPNNDNVSERNTDDNNVDKPKENDGESREDDEKKEIKEKEDDVDNRSNDDKNINVKKMTEKRFSLIDAINDVANNRSLDNVASKVNEIGTQEMRASGLSFGGQIQIPMSELRGNVTVAAEGEDVVATDLFDIVGPLRAKNVLVQAGAKFLTGLVGDVQIPIMSATNVNWAEETGAASDGAPTFTNVTLSPKRLTAYVNISKQLLNQHSVDVDNMIRTDIIRAISSKLESTILGSAAGTTTQPAGLFYDQTPEVIADMSGIAKVEGDVENANVYGNPKWIINPKFKAALRTMAKGSNIAQSLYENGEIDGTSALSTSNVGDKLGVYGDFSQLAIGQWGAIDLTVDPYTQAKNGMIVLVVNAYFDAKVVRPEAFGFATTSNE